MREGEGKVSTGGGRATPPTYPKRPIPVRLQRRQLLLVDLDLDVLILPDALDLVENLGVAVRFEDQMVSFFDE